MMYTVKLSNSVSKLGTGIATLNFPAIVTCRKNAPCAAGCYARKGRFQFESVKNRHTENYMCYLESPERFWAMIEAQLFMVPYRFFRYFSAGDIPDAAFLVGMVELAEKFPETKFLCFTKQFEIVNAFVDDGGEIPENLSIVFSTWGDWMPENPHNFPMSFVEFKNQASNALIPENAYKCPGYCGECAMSGCSCWDLKHGEAVKFKKH